MSKSVTQATRRLSQILGQTILTASPRVSRSGSFSAAVPSLLAERKSSIGGSCSPIARSMHNRKASLPITALLVEPSLVKLVQPLSPHTEAADCKDIKPETPKPRITYSIKDLLDFRHSNRADVEIAVKEVIDDGMSDAEAEKPGVIAFRAGVSGKKDKIISFYKDMDVSEDCVVTCYGLHQSVDWPGLNTFCKKTVGIAPVTVRMDRRQQPPKAIIVFSSPEEASNFVGAVPEGAKLKGRKPHFRLGYKVSVPAEGMQAASRVQ